MPESEAKRDWMKEHTTFIGIKLNNNKDSDIIQKLSTVPSKQGYIKSLIKADIAKDS